MLAWMHGIDRNKRAAANIAQAGWLGRFFHSAHLTFAYYEIQLGAALPAHAHENEEVRDCRAMIVDFPARHEAAGIEI